MSNGLEGALRIREQRAAHLIHCTCVFVSFSCAENSPQVISVGLLQSTMQILNIPFRVHQGNSPSAGNEVGIKKASSYPPPAVKGEGAIVISEICSLSQEKYGWV